MKRKAGKTSKSISKINKQDKDEEEAFISRITDKTAKKLKKDYLNDDLSSDLLSKEELIQKIYDEAKPYFNLPRDVKLIILNFLELFVSKEDMDQMILYEEKSDLKQKSSSRYINFIPYFFGHFYDSPTPFIVFKNIILDTRIRDLFPGMYLNIIPFTNFSFDGKIFPNQIYKNIFNRFVKNRYVEILCTN